ncbi:hypothetical protein TREAZ_2294 [Leadbettera azotonutricia ZAS-9]|uniref:Uncharacterized protein n=1 Tax=Leadbettera azotonutricia (strain ATCC BAA-888 / DSM 13862 / ZAS-9) TaxID=545695 RepID=F5Y813_LEAAZ|nr:hypothetical protein TREAZ_2294 [Leadbettera azotonutricia ZAS-9]
MPPLLSICPKASPRDDDPRKGRQAKPEELDRRRAGLVVS